MPYCCKDCGETNDFTGTESGTCNYSRTVYLDCDLDIDESDNADHDDYDGDVEDVECSGCGSCDIEDIPQDKWDEINDCELEYDEYFNGKKFTNWKEEVEKNV